MIRTTGLKSKFKPFEAVSMADNIYFVRWDCVEIERTDLAVWAEEIFYHKPAENELRNMFFRYYNAITDNKILTGFVWKDMPVWLSEETQRNYKAAYDIAVQKNGATLPVEFKFGSDSQPIYHVFHNIEELEEFYLLAIQHVQKCLAEGWRLKDSIDYSLYGIAQNA